MTGLIDIAIEGRAAFPRAPFAIRHRLAEHPLFSLARLAELARALPRHQIETNSGKAAIDQSDKQIPLTDLEPKEIVRRIEDVSAWMVLNNVERVPEYAALLKQVLDEAARDMGFADADAAGLHDIQGFVYVSSAGATTPFHADPGDNFFVQIRGDKFFHIIDNSDGAVAGEDAFEAVLSADQHLAYKPEFEQRATVYALKAGDGCFVPYLWPHWVRTGATYSISMAVTWKTKTVIRSNHVLMMNAALRKMGLPQRAPGAHPALDTLKAGVYATALAALHPVRQSQHLRLALHALLFGSAV